MLEGIYIYIYIYMCKMEGEEVETKEVWLFAPPRKMCATSIQMMIIPSFRKPIIARDRQTFEITRPGPWGPKVNK